MNTRNELINDLTYIINEYVDRLIFKIKLNEQKILNPGKLWIKYESLEIVRQQLKCIVNKLFLGEIEKDYALKMIDRYEKYLEKRDNERKEKKLNLTNKI